jgi:nitrate reductase gamma subunit
MDITLPQIATYFAYVFVVVAYAVKVWKYFKMPTNLRWEIYPIPHEKGSNYGGSYMEEPEFWTKAREKNTLKDIWEIAKKYLTMWGYYRRVKSYWLGLYPWHVGFYLIVLFHGLAFLGALLIQTVDLDISGGSANAFGQFMYYLTIVVALGSFILGTIGSIGLLIKRLTDHDLRDNASPQNFFNYIFFLALFVSGLVVFFATDGTFNEYRNFWIGLLTLEGADISVSEYVHIMIFAVFLVYLPFTRSTHYITMPLTYFKIRWNDAHHRGGFEEDRKLQEILDQPVAWEASHIQTGKSWGEIVAGMPEKEKGDS